VIRPAFLAIVAVFGAGVLSCAPPSRVSCCAADSGRATVDCSRTSVLNDFGKEPAREALFRHLCASADWRVTEMFLTLRLGSEPKRVVEAEKRTSHSSSIAEAAVAAAHGSVRVSLRFDAGIPEYWDAANFALAEAGAESAEVPLLRAPGDSGDLVSTLRIRGDSLLLEISEWGGGRERPRTREAIKQLTAELRAVRDSVETVVQKGYLPKILPQRSIRQSDSDSFEVRSGGYDGDYIVSGYVNAHEKGYVTIRTFDAASGKELQADLNSWQTVEYVGWSDRTTERFFFESPLGGPGEYDGREVVYGPNGEEILPTRQIRLEVWFHGGASRKLLEATKSLVPSNRKR